MTPLESHRLHGLDNVRFFLCWLRRPARLGAVVPSGQALAAALAGQIDAAAPGACRLRTIACAASWCSTA